MDSLTYKQLSNDLQKGMMRLTEQLEEAVDGDLSEEEVTDAVSAARQKLADYEEALSRFDGDAGKRASFEEKFAESVAEIRAALTQLT
jgi:hypothetical protein